jgi:hypothetical protein
MSWEELLRGSRSGALKCRTFDLLPVNRLAVEFGCYDFAPTADQTANDSSADDGTPWITVAIYVSFRQRVVSDITVEVERLRIAKHCIWDGN